MLSSSHVINYNYHKMYHHNINNNIIIMLLVEPRDIIRHKGDKINAPIAI